LHWGFVAYTDLDTLRSPAYIGNDVKVRFTVNADSFSKAALNSTRYIPFRLANYPRNCVFPAEPAILRKQFQFNGKGPGKQVLLRDTLVFKLAHAFVVGSQDKHGIRCQLSFEAHEYCTSIFPPFTLMFECDQLFF
jgi:hypothetical protein